MHSSLKVLAAAGLAVAIAAATPAAWAQSQNALVDDKAAFAVLSIKDGLLNNSVSGIVQDSKGFIWFSTQGGLCRFDGSGFKHFENEPFNDNSLSGNLVQTLFLDKGDLLWVGTYNGLDRFDIATERFIRYRYAVGTPDSLSNDLVIAIARDARGSLWVGTLNGLNRLDEPSGKFIRYYHDPIDPHSIPNNTVRALHLDSGGRLWVGCTGGGLASYDYEADRFDCLSCQAGAAAGRGRVPASLSMQSIEEDEEGNLWLGGWGTGLIRFSPRAGSSEVFPLPDNRIYAINTQEPALVRAGTWGGGLYVLDKETKAVTAYRYSRSVGALPNDVVYSMLLDASGELWIGTNGGGVARMDRTRKSFQAYVSDPNDPGALPNGKVIAAMVDSRGELWVSVYSAGIHRLDKASGTWRHFRHSDKDPGSLGDDTCNYLFEDSGGILWVGTNSGLSRFDRERESFVTYRNEPGDPDSPSSNIIYAMLEDPDGNLWIGTYTTGLDYWNRSTGEWRHYPYSPGAPGSISDNLVNALCYDEYGRLWIGTNNGLNRFEEGRFVRYYHDSARKQGISSNSIQRIKRDSKGILWITTRGGGIMRYNHKSDSFTSYTRKDGLPNNIAYSILEDGVGDLWIVTQTGIALYDRETGTIKRISLFKDLENASFNTGSCEGPGGELYFGSVGMIVRFEPARYEANRHVPPVYITDLRAANRSKLGGPVAKGPSEAPIRLANWENSVEFRFAALDFRDPAANQFAYILEGFDKAWTYSSDRNFATYTNLPGGRFVFRVKAANNDGLWNEVGAALPFSVASPPFLSVPALAVYLLVIAFAGYGLATMRSARLLKAKLVELIDTQVALKAASEDAQRLAIEADRANKAKSAFIATVSHEIRTPMNGVVGMAELLSRTRLDPKQDEYVRTIRRSGETLLSIINDVLDFSKIEAEAVKLELIPFELEDLVERAAAVFDYQASTKSIGLEVEIDPSVPRYVRGDPLRVGQVLSNLIGNAVKFTDRGTVRVLVDLAPEGALQAAPAPAAMDEGRTAQPVPVRFRIVDTGIGIKAEQLSTLFTPFSQADQSTTRRYGGTGLGLAISKRFVDLMGGRISAESVSGSGSTFTFVLPLPPDDKTESAEASEGGEGSGRALSKLRGKRVLVVDDDPVNRRVAASFVEELGGAAEEAESGHAAIVKLGASDFDLVLMDCSMPGMDGYQTTSELRQGGAGPTSRFVPIAAMTARTQREDKERCLASGMDDYISKPISLGGLESLARRIFRSARESASSPAGRPGAFDLADFRSRYEGNERLAKDILELFLAQTRPIFEEARAALPRGEFGIVSDLMHRLKGSSGAIGGMRLCAASDRLMKLARVKDGAVQDASLLARLVEEYELELAALEEEIRAFLEEEAEKQSPDE